MVDSPTLLMASAHPTYTMCHAAPRHASSLLPSIFSLSPYLLLLQLFFCFFIILTRLLSSDDTAYAGPTEDKATQGIGEETATEPNLSPGAGAMTPPLCVTAFVETS